MARNRDQIRCILRHTTQLHVTTQRALHIPLHWDASTHTIWPTMRAAARSSRGSDHEAFFALARQLFRPLTPEEWEDLGTPCFSGYDVDVTQALLRYSETDPQVATELLVRGTLTSTTNGSDTFATASQRRT